MAHHYYPAENETLSSKPPHIHYTSHRDAAIVALELLSQMDGVTVRKIMFTEDKKCTCWYVTLDSFPKSTIINLSLYGHGRVNVEFCYIECLPTSVRDDLPWQNRNWQYASISPNKFTFQEVLDILEDYIPCVSKLAAKGKLTTFGTSKAELLLLEVLLSVVDDRVIHGEYPSWLRNADGALLQLDFQIPSYDLAIEVQGPHHFMDFFGKPDSLVRRQLNDNQKVEMCIRRGLSLIWMQESGVMKSLFRDFSFESQKEQVAALLSLTRKNHPCHVIWEGPYDERVITLDTGT